LITIEEKKTKNLPGYSSLTVSFPYRAEYVQIIKYFCKPALYDAKTHTWEVPCTSLSKLLDNFCKYDEVSLHLLEDRPAKAKDKVFELQKYQTKPFSHQLDGIQYGLNHDKFLLLDAPGLGKTLTITYLAQELKQREGLKHVLVICGINSLKFNWKAEIEKHSKLSCRILGQYTNTKGELKVGSVDDRLAELKKPIKEFFVITNIQTLREKKIIDAINNGKNEFGMIVVDEIHTCKNPTSQQGKNLLKLKTAKHKIGLTGTLITNTPMDSYVPLKFIESENCNFSNFKYYYMEVGDNFQVIYKHLEDLRDQINEVSLRRTKDILDLPPKTIINEFVEMDSAQAKFYDNVKNGIIDQVDKVEMTTANLLAMVARLRQATACPSILTTENISSAKIERAVDLIEQITANGDKVLVFSTFKETIYQLTEKLKDYAPIICTGDYQDAEVQNNKDIFMNDPNRKVMLATWQKMGVGHTLTAASYAIFIDVPWTNADYEQAQDRIHRISAKKPVFIYHLLTQNTVDERVLQIVEDKEAISDYIVDYKITEKGVESLKKYIQTLK